MTFALSTRVSERLPSALHHDGKRHPPRTTRSVTVLAAKRAATKDDPLRKGRGYIKEDNSGKSNIYGTVPDKLWVSSPSSAKVSQSGLGGLQGIAVLGIALAAVVVITTGVLRFEDTDDLKAVRVQSTPSKRHTKQTPHNKPRWHSSRRPTR